MSLIYGIGGKGVKLIEAGDCQGPEQWGKRGDDGQRMQTFSYATGKFWEPNAQHSYST